MQRILDKCPVPVIVKETGCGMAARQVKQLLKAGFTCFDIGGAGGTNFPAIEAERYGGTALLNGWGLNTAQSLLEAGGVCGSEGYIAACGGIRSGLDAAKALALGADIVGMAGNVLEAAVNKGEDAGGRNNFAGRRRTAHADAVNGFFRYKKPEGKATVFYRQPA